MHHKQATAASMILPITTVLLAAGIFVVDTITDLEIAVAVLYVVVLLSVRFCGSRGVLLVSAGCVALTVLSAFLSNGGTLRSGLINSLISVVAIAATTYLALKTESAKSAMHEARAQLAHVARVTTLGELTASLAHEINQPLAAILTSGNACLRWLAMQPPNLDKAMQSVERIVNDAARAGIVIDRIRALARPSPLQKGSLDINATIKEVIVLMERDIERHQIALRMQLADNLPPILGDRVQLQQVVLNLIMNAVESLASMEEGQRRLQVRSSRGTSKDVVVRMSDNGRGIDATKLDEIFQPFYTTKEHGIGIGLAISRTIIEAHDGRIWAESNWPGGATFQFTLPIEGRGV
jgi:C4-dicarboxylate-specific signal transduction histidine kinase